MRKNFSKKFQNFPNTFTLSFVMVIEANEIGETKGAFFMKNIVLAFVLCFVLLATVGCALNPDDIFDARNHSSEFNIRCACALGSRLNCDHGHFLDKNGEGYDLFVWRENATLDGVPVTKMRDFDESYFVKESEDEPDPNVIEAYGDNTKRYMVFTDGVPNFGDYLFHNMPDVPKIYVPDSVKEIGEHTFDEGCKTVIACHKGSYAEEFANAHGMTVEIVE